MVVKRFRELGEGTDIVAFQFKRLSLCNMQNSRILPQAHKTQAYDIDKTQHMN